ncbi:MAG: SDR family NAD(P)-dependent oxidoreductase [Rhodanobacter sp.]
MRSPTKAPTPLRSRGHQLPGTVRAGYPSPLTIREIIVQLENRRIAVTGGFGALGAATVLAALAAGAQVVAIDRTDPPAGGLGNARCLGGVDLADPHAAQEALAAAAKSMGGLDALVNIAGTFRYETVADGDLDTWDLLYRINLRTAVAASQAALKHLQAGGRIINIGAASALKAGAGIGAYAASKSGVMRLTETLAEELKERNITVNALLPSILDTPPNRADMPSADFARWVTPRQLADVILFLLSEQSSAITGALIPVTGRV